MRQLPHAERPGVRCSAVQDWIKAVGAKTAYIEPGSLGEKGCCESFNARCPDELLNGEIFYSPQEVQILIEEWRTDYNTKRPHSGSGCRPPAPEILVQMDQRPIMHEQSNWTAQVGADQAQVRLVVDGVSLRV